MTLILRFIGWIMIEKPFTFDQTDFDREYNAASRTARIRTREYRNDGF